MNCPVRDAVSHGAWTHRAGGIALIASMVLLVAVALSALSASDLPGSDDGDSAMGSQDAAAMGSGGEIIPLFLPALLIRNERVLENVSRKRVYFLIQAHPGIHLRELVRASRLGFGEVAHHVAVLEHSGRISSVSAGLRRCLYPVDTAPLAGIPRLSCRQVQILECLEGTPNASAPEVAREVGVSPKTIGYHLRRLRALGLPRQKGSGGVPLPTSNASAPPAHE